MLLTVAYPTVEPVTLDQASLHLRLDPVDSNGHPDDDLVAGLITAAREWCESFTGQILAGTGYELRLAAFTDEIELPAQPVREVAEIAYVDADGVPQVLDPALYELSPDPFAPTLSAATTNGWPEGTDVRVSFTAGYLPEADSTGLPFVPASIRAAMLLLIGHLYANREETTAQAMTMLPMGVKSLLRPYRQRLGMA